MFGWSRTQRIGFAYFKGGHNVWKKVGRGDFQISRSMFQFFCYRNHFLNGKTDGKKYHRTEGLR